MNYSRWLIITIVLTLLMWASTVAIEHLAAQNDPKFLKQCLIAIEADARIHRHIDDVESSDYEFQTNGSLPDTLAFAVTADGEKGTVVVRGQAISDAGNDQWRLIQADTIFSY